MFWSFVFRNVILDESKCIKTCTEPLLPLMRFKSILLIIIISSFSINTNADVLKCVVENGNTHYSNTEKKSSRNKTKVIKFVEYESLVKTTQHNDNQSTTDTTIGVDSFPDVSKELVRGEAVGESDSAELKNHRIVLDKLDEIEFIIKRKSRNTQHKVESTKKTYNSGIRSTL